MSSEVSPELQGFLNKKEQVKVWPAKPKNQLIILAYLADQFSPDKVYTETEVNELLNAHHAFGDPALLRRELYEKRFLDREPNGSKYRKVIK